MSETLCDDVKKGGIKRQEGGPGEEMGSPLVSPLMQAVSMCVKRHDPRSALTSSPGPGPMVVGGAPGSALWVDLINPNRTV